eukprot:gene845-9094_t
MDKVSVGCVTIIGQANNPLFIKVYDKEEEDLCKFHYISHTSLDTIEERVFSRKNLSNSSDMYLGFLFPSESYKIYGFITNTKTKFVLILDESEVKDQDVKNFFVKLQNCYVDIISNPFYVAEKKITSKTFEKEVDDLVEGFSDGNPSSKKFRSKTSYQVQETNRKSFKE